MKTEINNAIKVLKKGGVILYPTDTIWGIGCDALNNDAVIKVYEIKKRMKNKPLISLVSNTQMIDRFTNSKQMKITFFSKPTTVIYQNTTGLANYLMGDNNTAAFRIPNDQFCQNLITSFKLPIVSTSANISGATQPTQFSEISNEIKNNVDYIVNLRTNEIMHTPSDILFIQPDGSVKKIR